MRLLQLLAVALLCVPGMLHAQDSVDLSRDEVSVHKKKLVAISKAVGGAPTGYVQQSEDFNLPTSAYGKKGGFQAIESSVHRKFGGDVKSAKKAEKDMGREYQKKMMDAMAKGDYEAMQKYQAEMQKKAGEVGGRQADASTVEPIEMDIALNQGAGQTIDPDNVLFDKVGVIAIKEPEHDDAEKARAWLFFDPTDFKSPGKLSRAETKVLEKGLASKTSVKTVVISFHGPTAMVEAWAKKVDTKAVLAQLD